MKALTWKQPFAELMFYGKIETRTRTTNYRGPVLICAGKQTYSTVQLIAMCGTQFERTNGIFQAKKKQILSDCGHAIAVAELVGCRQMTPEDAEKCFVDYKPWLYCWIFEKPRRIQPFPFKGVQGWKTLSPDFQRLNIRYIDEK